MRVTKIEQHPIDGYIVYTDVWVEQSGMKMLFPIHVEDGGQLLIKDKGFLDPEDVSVGDEIQK